MRKRIIMATVIGMTLCLAACGSKATSDKEKETSPKTEVSSKDAQDTDMKENEEKQQLDEAAYIGEYKDNDVDEVAMEIAKGEKEDYKIHISIYRLADFDDGVGTLTEKGMTFTATDPEGNPISGIIELDGNMAEVTFTDSTWSLLSENSSFVFEKMSDKTELSVDAAGVYSSKDGIVTLNTDGTGTISFQDTVSIRWNDHELIGADFTFPYTISGDTITIDVDGMERSFKKDGEMPKNDTQNPIMNFVGNYQSGRATMLVEASGDNGAKITISWAGSAWNEAVYTMSGECSVKEDSILVSYQDSTCRNVEYNDDGTVASDTTEYTDGSGTLTFKGNTVEWDDDSEDIDNLMVFEYIPTSD